MMSRPAHLPPRCPLQNKCLRTRSLDSSDQISQGNDQFLPELFRYPSMDSLLEEDPSWLDDLLSDSDTSPQGRCHRRSASDSVTVSSVLTTLNVPAISSLAICEPQDTIESMHGTGLEANCVYGPNSPRKMSNLTDSENAMVSALLEKVPQSKLQFSECSGGSRIHESSHGDVANAEPETEKTSRRRPGQRSRVRKLQYIADLQKTVDALQTIGTELSAQVASLFQQRVALSLENQSLNRQIALRRHEKIIKDGEHQHLKNEAERLKLISARHRRSKSSSSSPFSELSASGRSPTWRSLDFARLSLGEASAPHGFGH